MGATAAVVAALLLVGVFQSVGWFANFVSDSVGLDGTLSVQSHGEWVPAVVLAALVYLTVAMLADRTVGMYFGLFFKTWACLVVLTALALVVGAGVEIVRSGSGEAARYFGITSTPGYGATVSAILKPVATLGAGLGLVLGLPVAVATWFAAAFATPRYRSRAVRPQPGQALGDSPVPARARQSQSVLAPRPRVPDKPGQTVQTAAHDRPEGPADPNAPQAASPGNPQL